MLNDNLTITERHDYPFTALYVDNFFTNDTYEKLHSTFPTELKLYEKLFAVGKKYSLNDFNKGLETTTQNDKIKPLTHSQKFNLINFLKTNTDWSNFYDYIQSQEFRVKIDKLLPFLNNYEITNTKFEFSLMPANGGNIAPHPDIVTKVITMVFYFPPIDWDSKWGGQFETHLHKTDPNGDFSDRKLKFRTQLEWDELDPLLKIDYVPNRVIIMKRTGNSIHSVKPMTGPDKKFRTTCTINFRNDEKKDAEQY